MNYITFFKDIPDTKGFITYKPEEQLYIAIVDEKQPIAEVPQIIKHLIADYKTYLEKVHKKPLPV